MLTHPGQRGGKAADRADLILGIVEGRNDGGTDDQLDTRLSQPARVLKNGLVCNPRIFLMLFGTGVLDIKEAKIKIRQELFDLTKGGRARRLDRGMESVLVTQSE